ncbi:MAG: MBL fold metallo-hydrolase [Chloroflexi bacterium]|nr:MAG: MBL fold metallo-hydrolase [Chloroflexota bacterium]TME45070.1 MAG: MBL fold metallo-hydrolase [Chloroflexota bacterium]
MLEKFTWYKQSAYKWKGDGVTMYIDPWGLKANEEPADIIFITHAHADHFEPEDIEKVRKSSTQFVAPKDVAEKLKGNVKAIKPGDSGDAAGIKYQAVPAYNTAPHRLQAHPKSNNWVGYILNLDGQRYWFSGDTDPNPDIEQVKTDVALVCIGGDPYVMNASEAAGLVKKIRPQLAVPNHYGFVVGVQSDGEKFAKEAAPVKVQIMKPVNAFEMTEAKAH